MPNPQDREKGRAAMGLSEAYGAYLAKSAERDAQDRAYVEGRREARLWSVTAMQTGVRCGERRTERQRLSHNGLTPREAWGG